MDGVAASPFFVLYLTRCLFSRWFCQQEIRKARRPVGRSHTVPRGATEQ